MNLIALAIIGGILGRLAAGWAAVLLWDMNSGGLLECSACHAKVSRFQRWVRLRPYRCKCGKASTIFWPLGSTFALAPTFALFGWLLLDVNCQAVHEVRPDSPLWASRLPFHLTLIFLLWVATLTDLLDYVVPDEVVYVGIFIGVVSAFATGELQMIHIWVNWDEALVTTSGPYLPDWMKNHQHLHGLAWSLAGLACGASLTWLVRTLSHWLLGQPALGFGDVTLMALIGSFIGWQPTLCVLAIAPLVGVVIGITVRLTTGRSFIAYGPYLAASALIVICSWRWLWADYWMLRDIFSHWPTIVGMIVGSLAALTIMLLGLQVFRRLPADRMRK
ncbi:prepilin peptidase [Fuerstiella marisgermanici]|uniref:Type IV leader peptidase family protein n=1 Tax=Fuerstiella marisgermanici TaxID=1891926 RepID=A0A1P8W9W3_9PLAN|nr:prepilin peptidase [Fuerstiella marisgermanici]APZ90840.1 Type IV leader peptidase family protein [Fuerstiella marisgermanici]